MANEWRKIKRDASWPDVVKQFRDASKSEITKIVSFNAVSIGLEEPIDDVIRVALYVHSQGLRLIEVAEIVYSLRGYPKARFGLSDITSDRAVKVVRKMSEELAVAFYDMTNGRVFQASHRIARARAHLGRIGERKYHELFPTR